MHLLHFPEGEGGAGNALSHCDVEKEENFAADLSLLTNLRNYELNGYADDADKADERGFKKLRYNIDKLKSALSLRRPRI